MYKKILFLFLCFCLGTGVLFAQDIHSVSPVVLPQAPATSYVVGPGQNVTITSAQSVTLGPGTWLQQGSIVAIKVANSPIINPAPNNPSADADKNWVQTKSYDEDGNLIGESKSFFDLTGKSLQNQVKSISAGHVLASQTIYDALGRPAVQTLAAPINNAGFAYKASFVTNGSGTAYTYENFDQAKTNNPDPVGNNPEGTLGWYYSNNNSIDPFVPATSYPYSRMDYYKDGTGAAKRSASVGDQLKMGAGHEERSFVTPVANELDLYLQIRNKFFPSSVVGELPVSLAANAVQNVVHDANGKEAAVIVDRSGNQLMSARPGADLQVINTVTLVPEGKSIQYFKLMAAGTVSVSSGSQYKLYDMAGDEQELSWNGNSILNAGYYKLIATGVPTDQVTFSYTNGYADIGYNFYNDSGQLLAAIAPNGVKALITNGINSYATLGDIPFVNTNEYDLQGRVIAATQTDAGRTEFIYRTDGSVRFSQNTLQRNASPARFSYVNYDRWGRSVESGEYVSESISFAAAKIDEALQENSAPDGGLTGTKLSQVKTQYDLVNNSHGLGNYLQDESFLKGAISFTENENGKTWYNYDAEGRLLWLVKEVAGLGIKTVDYTYDTKGNVTKVDFQKDNNAERFTHDYEYDADNRLKAAYTAASGSPRKEQARYYYYLHGPLKRVELAENLQGTDYTYTPQGWLKSINHPISGNDPGADGVQNSFSSDAFGMTIEYFSGDYARNNVGIASLATGVQTSYNGNIMGRSWKSLKPQGVVSTYGTGVNNPAMVTYAYDDKYQFNNNKYGTPNFASNSFTEALNANREYNLSYDPNGNIKTLNRTNASGASTAAFNYTYQNNTNKLAGVDNYASYSYDALGQMVSQQKVNGQGYYVDYDVNGKVAAVYSDAAKTQLTISFGYDETGLRIRKTDHIQNVVTYYVHDASGNVLTIYDNKGTALQQKEVPVYASSRIGMYNRLGNSYQYELTDHSGNVRVVINGTKTASGQADVVYYSDYFPIGSPMTLASNDYRYGYQGQFAEADKETGWSNFQLRMYDPVIGRWMSTDPYRQYASPYVGMGNNYLNGLDPDGGAWHILAGAIIGGGYAAVQLGIEGKLDLSKGSTWGKIGLGAVAGAATAAMPGTLLGGAGAFTIATSSSVIDQAIDIHSAGKSIRDRTNYNFTKAGIDGVIAAASLGAGTYIAKQWRVAAIRNNWDGPINRHLVSKMFYEHPGLTGFAAGNMLDFMTNMGKFYGNKVIDKTYQVILPEVVIKPNGSPQPIVDMVDKHRPK